MKRRRNPVVDYATYCCVRGVYLVLKWLPEWIAYPCVYGLGRAFLVFARERRRIAVANLSLAFGGRPASELARIAARACGNAFLVAVDVAKLARYHASGRIEERIDRCEWDALLPEIARIGGRAPILCSPHLGSWEVAGHAAGTQFHGLHVIARPLRNRHLQDFIRWTRSQVGQHVHPRRGGIRRLLAGLRAGQAVATMPDQNQRLRGIFVPVFGKPAACDRSQARLAQLSGSPIVVGSAIRIGRRFRFRIVIADVFAVPTAGDGQDPVRQGTLRLQQAVEKLILQAPEQYFWVHNRYRTRPPQEKQQARKQSA